MAYCGKCGSKLANEEVTICPACGASTQPPEQDPGRPVYHPPVVPGAPMKADIQDAQDNKVMAILAYLGPLVLVPLLAAPGSRFARYHTDQGLALVLCCTAFYVVFGVLTLILVDVSWRLGAVFSNLGWIGVVFPVLAVKGIINASRGEMVSLPVIGNFQLLG